MTNDNEMKLLDMNQAAGYLGIKKNTLYQLCMRNEITRVKIGKLNRFRMSDLQDFINKRIIEKAN
ncbi:MAG: DNA-binding protein [Candidatus Brocadia sp.]|nr:DNA-binding protein [Candidatus Brocadia sp.]